MKKTYLSFFLLFVGALLFISAGKKPVTLFLVGDSTMADNLELDATPERGWGQLLPSYQTGNVVVANFSGAKESTKSVLLEGTWKEVTSRLHRKDIVFIELGHNDEQSLDVQHYTTVDVFEDNLMTMVKEAKKKGAKVVLLTPIARRYYLDSVAYPRHGAYPEAVRRVAKCMQVPVIDLTAKSEAWLVEVGEEASAPYYTEDNVNLTEDGALLIGRMAVEDLQKKEFKFMKGLFAIPDSVEIKYTTPVQR